MKRGLLTALVLLTVAWIFIVLGFYYWGHQASLKGPVVGLGRTLGLMLVSAALSIVALSGGWLLSRLLHLSYDSLAEAIVFSLGLGMGLMALLTLALGFAGWLRPLVFWVITLIWTALALPWLYRFLRRTPFESGPPAEPLSRFDCFLLAVLGINLIAALQIALIPPIGWDALTTHLVLVKEALGAKRLLAGPLVNRPLVGHYLFIWGTAVGGDIMPQLISFWQSVAMVATVWTLGRRFFGQRVALLAATVLYSVEVLVLTAVWPYVDLATGLFSLLAVFALIKWQVGQAENEGRRAWLMVSAVMGVLAAHTKLNGLFVLPALALGAIIGLWWQRGRIKAAAADIVLATLAGGLLACLWTLSEKALSSTATTSVANVVGAAASAASRTLASANLWAQVGRFLVIPWKLTVLGRQGTAAFDGAITPLFLILLPLLLFLRRKERVILSLGIVSLIEFVAWLLVPRGYYQSRHLIAAYPLFSLLTAYVIHRLPELDRKWFSLSGFFRLVLAMVLGTQTVAMMTWREIYDPLPYLLGIQSRTEYLAHHLNSGWSPGYYNVMQVINETLPQDSKVGFVSPESRVYYCQRDYVHHPFQGGGTAEEMAAVVQEQGLTHLLVSWSGITYYLNFDPAADDEKQHQRWIAFSNELERFLDDHAVLEYNEQDSFGLYRLELGQP
jgi:hypothetical protein